MGWMLAAVLAAQSAPQSSSGAELALVQLQIAGLEQVMREGLARVEQRLEGLETQAEAPPPVETLATPFLASPPPSSDLVGVARVPVFAPRLVVDSPARHDIVFLRVRRVEAAGMSTVARLELGQDPEGVALPIDRNGALYVVDWSTTDGHSYELQLRDGLSGLVAAAVKVKPLEHEGRFLLVGYAVE